MRAPSRRSVSVHTVFPSGALCVAGMVNGQRVSRTYYGFTKAEAVAAFLAEVRA